MIVELPGWNVAKTTSKHAKEISPHKMPFSNNLSTTSFGTKTCYNKLSQLVKPCRTRLKSYTRSRVQTPLKSWTSLRSCINCVHNCDDQSSFDLISAVHRRFISYISFTIRFQLVSNWLLCHACTSSVIAIQLHFDWMRTRNTPVKNVILVFRWWLFREHAR